MKYVLRLLARFGLALVASVAGCWGGTWRSVYGVEPPYGIKPPEHDPGVVMGNFDYSPKGAVEPGTQMHFAATTNKPTGAAFVTVYVGDPTFDFFALQDNGVAPDQVAADGVWTGDWTLPLDAPAGSQPISVQLKWLDGYPGLELDGTPLEILDPEDSE